ncbi:MAG: hypothetical protein Q9160_005753 [Pyrenula sp. 1 TL-2023]
MTFASSPLGSIASRLPPHPRANKPPEEQFALCDEPNVDWRFSIAPESCAGIDNDVREPIHTESPHLPTMPLSAMADFSVKNEPVSSGFSSPALPGSLDINFTSRILAEPDINHCVTESLQDGHGTFHLAVEDHDNEHDYGSDYCSDEKHSTESFGVPLTKFRRCTDLERPMSRLDVSLSDACFNSASKEQGQKDVMTLVSACSLEIPVDKSPSQHSIQNIVHLDLSEDMDVDLSSPSLAAAESAKHKRGYNLGNKENITPSGIDAGPPSSQKSTPMTRFRRNPFLTPFGHVKSRGSPAELQTDVAEEAEEMRHPQRRPIHESDCEQEKLVSFAKRINTPSFRLVTPTLRLGPRRSGVSHGISPNEVELLSEKTFPSGRFVKGATQTPCKPRKSGAAKFYSNNAAGPNRKTRNKRPRESPSPTKPLFRSSPIRQGISVDPAPEEKKIRSGLSGGSVASSEVSSSGHRMAGVSTGARGSFRVYDDEDSNPIPTIMTENDKEGLRELSPNVDVTPRSKRNRMGMVFARKPKERCPSYYDEDVIPRNATGNMKTDREA